MADSDADRRFDESQFALILKKAAEIQERDPQGRTRTGLTLPEMEAIAAEAGIDAGYVRQAVAALGRPAPTLWGRVVGLPWQFRAQRTVAGAPSTDQLAALLDALRDETGRPGIARDVLGAVEWSVKDDFGSLHVSVRPQGDATRVSVDAQRRDAAIVLGILLPLGGLFVGVASGTALGGSAPLGLGLMGATGGVLAGRLAWQRVAGRWRARVELLAERLGANLITKAETAEERTNTAALERGVAAQPGGADSSMSPRPQDSG